jgi:hypothetical protein
VLFNRVVFSSFSDHWKTPQSVYEALDKEFNFDFDPCPIGGSGGLEIPWGMRTFCNPPYSAICQWIKKAYEEHLQGKLVVLLIPSKTDTKYWHEYIMKANEIRFIKGRLRFGNATENAPFASCIVVFKPLKPKETP